MQKFAALNWLHLGRKSSDETATSQHKNMNMLISNLPTLLDSFRSPTLLSTMYNAVCSLRVTSSSLTSSWHLQSPFIERQVLLKFFSRCRINPQTKLVHVPIYPIFDKTNRAKNDDHLILPPEQWITTYH